MATGKEIKRLRGNLSAEKVAEFIGVNASRLRKWEERDSDPKDTDDVRKVEDYFGVSLSELAGLTNFAFVKKPPKNPDITPGSQSEVVLLRQIIQLKDQIIGMQSKENSGLQTQLDAAIKRIEAIDGKVESCTRLIQENNNLSVESNRLTKEGNEFLKQLEGLAELAKSERLQEAANLQTPYTKKRDGKGSQASSKSGK